MSERTLEQIYTSHLKREPKRYLKFFEEINRGLETDEYISWKIKEKMLEEASKVPIEKRQEVLETLKKGLSIGEVAIKLKLSSEVVSTVLYYNITNIKMLRGESI